MYTHCPHCETYFRVTSEQLKSAQGDVRCGRCYGTFNALENLVDEPPKTKKPTAAPTPTPEVQESVTEPAPEISDDLDLDISVKVSSKKVDHELKRERSQQLINELQEAPATSGNGRRLLWFLLALPLLALLTLQYLYFNIKPLSQNPDVRPVLLTMCSVLGCEVPLQRAPEQIKLVERDIRAHESKKDVLVVKAVMVNDAPFQQPFPVMQLSMHDITGHIMSGRRFTPDEYLADIGTNIPAGIPPRKSVAIRLELVDPGKEAVGFEFEFF